MNTPHNGDQRNGRPPPPADQATVGTVEHSLCGAGGLVLTVGLLALTYPALLYVTRPLTVLASTAVVVIATTVWLLIWLGLELLWEWQTGRLGADA